MKNGYEVRLSIDQVAVAVLEYCTSRKLLVREGQVRVVVPVSDIGQLVVSSEAVIKTVPDPDRTLVHRTRQRDELWNLLDNIDTLDDACRENDLAFRELTRKQAKRRFAIHNPDEPAKEQP